jgi:hypothetical protein
MRKAAWLIFGALVTAGLGYASYWVYLEVQQQVRGTLISGFGIFAGVMGAFALLGVAHVVATQAERLFCKRAAPKSDESASG